MSFTRILLGIVVGALSTGIMLSLAYYLIAVTDTASSSPVGDVRNWSLVILAIGAIIGVILGGVSGAIIVSFQLNFFKAILFGFLFNLCLSVVFFIWSGGPLSNHFLKYTMLSVIIAGILNGAIVSLITSGEKSFG